LIEEKEEPQMANKPTPQIDPLPGMGLLGNRTVTRNFQWIHRKPKPQTNLVQHFPTLRTVSPTATDEECHLATDYDAWMDWVDPDGIMKEDEFNTLTVAEKIELIREVASYQYFRHIETDQEVA